MGHWKHIDWAIELTYLVDRFTRFTWSAGYTEFHLKPVYTQVVLISLPFMGVKESICEK